ncbi:MAG: DUF3623 family protein, partial [Pseudomonadota bacterium]
MILAVLSALFIWWFSTGAILWATGKGAGERLVWGTAPLAAGAGAVLVLAGQWGTVPGAYLGFAAAIA